MRLAICHPYVIPARGGCETYIRDLTRRLTADGHEVHLLACRWDPAALPASVQLHQLPQPGRVRFLRPWRFSAACRDALAEGRHDLSISFDKVCGTDVLYPQGGLHAAGIEYGVRKLRSPLRRAIARGLRKLDLAHHSFRLLERRQYPPQRLPFVLVNSEFVRRHFLEHYGISPSRVEVLYSAIDPDRFAAVDRPARRLLQRQRWGLRADEPVALFVAMNYRLKGLEPLLRALPLVPAEAGLRLVVVGDPRTARYRRLAAGLGVSDRVTFAGFASDPRDHFFAADLLVHPTFYDPCSLVVLEARACGLPVITTRYNGASELLDPPHDGLVIQDPHDAAELAGALRTFADPARRRSAAAAALVNSKEWTWDRHYRLLLQMLAQAAQRKRAA
jgi:UDP-glucose:(heptosyl)LPS alpha-1,3-glucosyltransferase